MAGINSGILRNASPLSATQVKEVEKDVILNNKCIAYLDENNQVCFAKPGDPEGIKKLAWHNAYELFADGDVYVKKVYTRTGLDTFTLSETLQKSDIDGSWGATALAPGLYQTGAIALYEEQGASAVDGMMTMSWDELLANDAVHIEEGVVSTNFDSNTGKSASSDVLVGDLVFLDDGSITSIGSEAFYRCGGLKNILIPDSVTSIGHDAFYNCYGLTNLTVGNGVTNIDYQAFYNCNALTSVTIPDSVTSIGRYAFEGCRKLTAVHISSIESWYNIAFEAGNANPLCKAGKLYLNGELVTNLVIPDSVTSIGRYAFYNCSGLTSITIPDSVTSIGDGAFSGCNQLVSITIPNSVTSIGKEAFDYCSGLTSVMIGNGVTSIGSSAFEDCSGLTSITIPDSVTSIGSEAFSGCTAMTGVIIGNGVTSIGSSAFSYCTGLTSVTIGNSVTSIGGSAFKNCSELTSITIPNSVTSIGSYAFSGCSKLIQKETGVSYVDKWVIACDTSVTEVILRADTAGIGYNAFSDCSNLASIELPDSVTGISQRAFAWCSGLKSITIGNGVRRIAYWAFYQCSKLTSVTFNGTTSQWEEITKEDDWKHKIPATYVQCTDGQVTL